ncbi:hypothetical protein ACFQNF_19980 [Iodobacter arcticus]|uniref:Uncharacterized protein n=1 Tax=Iodobacter arcticus TaxID=590593 RepID=A0ABW2R353_9NEIS
MVIQGKQVTVNPGQDRHQSTETRAFKQSGIAVAVSAPALTMLQAAQTVTESAKTAGESKDGRVKALSAGTAALAAKNGIDAAKAAAADPSSVSVSITYGESKSESVTKTSQLNVLVSHLELMTKAESLVVCGGLRRALLLCLSTL